MRLALRLTVIPMAYLFALTAAASAQGPVAVPATFWGTVAINGAVVPAGTEVRGLIDGRDCTQLGNSFRPVALDGGVSTYAIEVVHESQQSGCGAEGRVVRFTVGGVPAAQAVPWAPGAIRVDLTVGAGGPLSLPTATPTASPPAAERTATAAAVSALTPRAGTPPLDDVNPRDLFGGATTAATRPPAETGAQGGSGTIGPLVLAVGAIAVAGMTAGWLIARRARPSSG